ncbi:hypothetical protein B0H14DRAFT_2706102, partial [Mycena olivaceomarginata]
FSAIFFRTIAFLGLGRLVVCLYVLAGSALHLFILQQEDTGGTHGPGWSTATADFLDELYARDDAEKAAAAEKLAVEGREEGAAQGRIG